MPLVFKEYFIDGPLHGKDKRKLYPDVPNHSVIHYTDVGELMWSYSATDVKIFDYMVRVWMDGRNSSTEVNRLKVAEMFMRPHADIVPENYPVIEPTAVIPPETPADPFAPLVLLGGMDHPIRCKEFNVLPVTQDQTEGNDDHRKEATVGSIAELVVYSGSRHDDVIMVDLGITVRWTVLEGPDAGTYEGHCDAVHEPAHGRPTAVYRGHRVETPWENPADTGEGDE